MRSLIQRLVNSRRRTTRATIGKPVLKSIESLENRQLMAADVGLTDSGNLNIQADPNGGSVEVRESYELSGWNYSTGYTFSHNVLVTSSGRNQATQVKKFAHDDVKAIIFNGSPNNDSFVNRTDITSRVAGGAGYDVLVGGRGDDRIDGGSGNDRILGGDGRDYLDGDLEHDIIYGGQGHDTLIGSYGNDRMYGQAGVDRLYGGSDNDYLDGGTDNDYIDGYSGDDTLIGGYGNDTAYGRHGNDRLYGGSDDDLLVGGDGVDYLDGYNGNDRLRGNAGRDVLFGGLGSDGLLGGSDPDTMIGGGGDDRFLWQYGDQIDDYESADARLRVDGTWSDAEIAAVDDALGVMHEEAGNTRLLKTSNKNDITLSRVHQWELDAANFGGNGLIEFYNWSFHGLDSQDRRYFTTSKTATIVFHEIGHNWDDESPQWNQFLALSGWTQSDPNDPANFARIDKYGQTWWYNKSAPFASNYARSHPLDDFAESFAAYFVQITNRPFKGDPANGNPATWIPAKVNLVSNLISNLA